MPVETIRDGSILRVLLDMPESKNALGPEVVSAIRQALTVAAADRDVALVVIASKVPHLFSVGMDLRLLQVHARNQGLDWAARAPIEDYVDLLIALATAPVPVMAVVDGLAVGGGVDICGSCDLLIATEDAMFSIAQLARGVFPLTTSAVLVPRIGTAQFVHWALGGISLSARRLFALGLVTQLCGRSDLCRVQENFERRIVGFDRGTMRAGFATIRDGDRSDRVARLRIAAAQLALNCATLREVS